MKKIGIITLQGNFNYGNRLQNFAVQELIKSIGYEAESVVCLRSSLKSRLKPAYNRVFSLLLPECKRYVRFESFNKKRISRKIIYTKDGLIPADVSDMYDAFAVGSDQVWNPELRKRERHNFFLRFTEPKKKVCISPSIGVPSIEDKYKDEYREYLKDFSFLSCREADGAQALSDLAGKECAHIIDPTLALTGDEWRTFAEPVKTPGKYLLLMFLGELAPNVRESIESFARERGLIVAEPSSKQDKYYSVSPTEFVYLLQHAEAVFTDSFHAAAFSVNLNRPFYVFDRNQNDGVSNKMTSRIASLTALMGLEDRYVKGDSLPEYTEKCDFAYANRVLTEQRKTFFEYLEKAVGSALADEEDAE